MSKKDVVGIASEHLGNAGSYKVFKEIDEGLLVAVPRELSRNESSIVTSEFEGCDVWNAYEFSTLKNNGFPATARLKIVYSVSSESIVESKSLKLYLHSFNFAKLGETSEEALERARNRVALDLSSLLKVSVKVSYYTRKQTPSEASVQDKKYIDLDKYAEELPQKVISETKDDRTLLEDAEDSQGVMQYFTTASMRSNCRVTHQPDWATAFIAINAETDIEPVSLLRFIVSLRASDHFHEEAAELIFDALKEKYQPENLEVVCLYTRRGGIDINPVRLIGDSHFVASQALLNHNELTTKGFRQ